MAKKKILFLINSLKFGGAENMFAKTMNAFVLEDYDVYVGLLLGKETDQGFSNTLKAKPTNIVYLNAYGFYDLRALFGLGKFVKSQNIKTIYSTLDESNIFAKLLKIICPNIKVTIREANVAGPKPLKFKFLDLVLNIFVRKIICVSEEVKDSLTKYLWLYKNKMVVLPNGVDIPTGQKNYTHTKEPIKFINVGSLTSKKGQKFLIEAAALVQKENPDSFDLEIIGDGAERESLEKMIRDRNLGERVKLLGQLEKEKVGEHYLNSDVFVLSSLWEGSPNVLLEAMSYGLVCISTRVSGALGMIEDGISGHLVPKGDSQALSKQMLVVIKNKEQFQTMGNNARQKMISDFSTSEYMKKMLRILDL